MSIRVGSPEHRDLFCRTFIETHVPYEPESLPWPRLEKRYVDSCSKGEHQAADRSEVKGRHRLALVDAPFDPKRLVARPSAGVQLRFARDHDLGQRSYAAPHASSTSSVAASPSTPRIARSRW